MDMKLIIICIFYTIISLQGSENPYRNTGYLTADALRIHKERQAIIKASEPEKVEICTFDALQAIMTQTFTYGSNSYQDISMESFYNNYTDEVLLWMNSLEYSSSRLTDNETQVIRNQYMKVASKDRDLPQSREIGRYNIVGVQPFKNGYFDVLLKREKTPSMPF